MKMKKQFLKAVSVVLSVVLIFSLSVTVFAAGSAVTFTLSSVEYDTERKAYVDKNYFKSDDLFYIKLNSTQIKNLGGLSFQIGYDANTLEFMERSSVCVIENSEPLYFTDTEKGNVRVIYENAYYGENISVTGAVFYLAFRVKALSESTTGIFTLNIDDLYDNSPYQLDIESNLNDSTTVTLTADTISEETLGLFKKLENITYPDSKADIDAATDAFNKLSSAQKTLLSTVYSKEYEWFTTALTRYNRLAEQASYAQLMAEVNGFKETYADVLKLTEQTVSLANEQAVTQAKQAYDNISAAAKTYLQSEGKLVSALSDRIDELKDIKAEVDEFLNNEAYAHIWNTKILEDHFEVNYTSYVNAIQLALLSYDLLSDEAKSLVQAEYEWLTKLNDEANKYLANDKAAAELAEKMADFQKRYFKIFTLNQKNVTESDRTAIETVISAWESLEDEELKEALKFRIDNFKTMLEILDELALESEDADTKTVYVEVPGENEIVTETVTETLTKNNVKVLKQKNTLNNIVIILFFILAVSVLILGIAYILCEKYKKKIAMVSNDVEVDL